MPTAFASTPPRERLEPPVKNTIAPATAATSSPATPTATTSRPPIRSTAGAASGTSARPVAGLLVGERLARQLERGVLAQDRLLESLQRRARIDSELVPQMLSRLPVGLERLGLTPAAVQREHQLAVQPLAQRMLAAE